MRFLSLPRFISQWWKLAVWRVNNQRRLLQRCRPGAIGPGLLTVRARISGTRPLRVTSNGFATKALGQLGSFFIGQHSFARELAGPFQRSERPVIPDALEIRSAPRRARNGRVAD